MKTKSPLSNGAMLIIHQSIYIVNKKAILIVPNTAGYYAESKNYGKAEPRINAFCYDLCKHYNVYYLVLPGQDPEKEELYSWESSIASVKEAIQSISFWGDTLSGVIGMCTGSAIAVQSFVEINILSFPLILFNTASKVRWNTIDGQNIFHKKYPNIRLDSKALMNAPMPEDVIPQHTGPRLQIISGKSDYSVANQRVLKNKVPGIPQLFLKTMSDAPIKESEEYQPMIEKILKFLKK